MRAVGRIVVVLSLVAGVSCGGTRKEQTTSIAYRRPVTRVTTTTTTIRPTTTTTTSSTSTTSTSTTTTTTLPVYSSGQCGGDLPPCWIMNRESRGIITAKNPVSSASGKWQILDSTWGKYGGYSHAMDAPEWVQDAKARSMALCNWQPPNYCA
jgi:predicted membrane-bound mannosyltransferase